MSEESEDNREKVAINAENVIFWAEKIFAFKKAVLYH